MIISLFSQASFQVIIKDSAKNKFVKELTEEDFTVQKTKAWVSIPKAQQKKKSVRKFEPKKVAEKDREDLF